MKKLEIDRMLLLATAHVSEATMQKLPCSAQVLYEDKNSPDWWPAFARDEGWVFWVPDDTIVFESAYANAPKDLREVLLYAQRNSCSWVMFDCDGPSVDDLYHYDW